MTIATPPSLTSPPPRPNPNQKLIHERVFSDPHKRPADEIEWDTRSVNISDETGKAVFKQDNVEVPKSWSDLALKVVASRYFYGEINTPQRETSVRRMVDRVTTTIADWGLNDGYFSDRAERDIFCDELSWLCLNQYGVFNSPVWFNVGLYHSYNVGKNGAEKNHARGNWRFDPQTGETQRATSQYVHPQCSACFIQRVDDNMESIMALATSEAMLFKFGSGTGTDLSTIRSMREKLSGGGHPSGPLSFLRIYDQVGNVVKSGGRTRRAAKMNTLYDWHGDIEEFIDAKQKEEKKAWALIEAGYDGSFNGEVYRNTVAFQNENLSVRVTDEFMNAAIQKKEWWTKAVTTGEKLEKKSANGLLRKISEGTYLCGDPGLQFDGAIQKWHTCKGTEDIFSTNPCSEYVFLDNTACNLASINLMKFRKNQGGFDVDRFKAAVRIFITAQEILVDNSSYPTKQIAENSHIFRTLGLGFANLGSLVMSLGLPYDSDEARAMAASISALMTGEAYAQSAHMAKKISAFPGFHDSRCAHNMKPAKSDNVDSMMEVIRLHKAHVSGIKSYPHCEEIKSAAESSWEEALDVGMDHGYRNAQVTVLAPTGTIAFMMDCDTTGIEPDIALVKYKLLAGGGNLKIVNRVVPTALRSLGYDDTAVHEITEHVDKHDTIEAVDGVGSKLSPNHLSVFDCAFKAAKGTRSIHYKAHLRMMSAVQPFISGAISKTVNLPNDCTVEEIESAYIEAWKMGLKCVAMYRDGSKRSQPLNTSKKGLTGENSGSNDELLSLRVELEEKKAEIIELWNRVELIGQPVRRRLPDTRSSITHKFDVAGHEGYVTVGLFEDGTPGELFITMSKEGSTVGGLMDSIGTLTSMALQYGVPLEALVRKFSFCRFEPAGYTKNKRVKTATSIVDYIFRWLATEFVEEPPKVDVVKNGNGHIPEPMLNALNEHMSQFQKDAPACPGCGVIMVRNASCYKCVNCGESYGCS